MQVEHQLALDSRSVQRTVDFISCGAMCRRPAPFEKVKTRMSNVRDLGDLIGNLPENEWLSQAACRHLELDKISLFFVDAGCSLSHEAQAMCGSCPVRAECLGHAYQHEIAGGYFGGVSPSRRRTLSREDALASLGSPG